MTIKPESLVPADLFTVKLPLRIELAYAFPGNLLFGETIYRKQARLWLHEDLAKVVLLAAKLLSSQNFRLVLYDGLRTIEAQQCMLETARVRDNPHWLEEPRLLSPPGAGGHPRGMAVDLSVETLDGRLLDMGTPFDYLAEEAGPEKNPAHRSFSGTATIPAHSQDIMENRQLLTNTMLKAADMLGTEILPLPQEWWDFRLPAEISETYEPLSDSDLPPQMRMTDTEITKGMKDFSETHFESLRQKLMNEILAIKK